jgi:cobalt-zinc-cadmium efflux system membrane fusion protein
MRARAAIAWLLIGVAAGIAADRRLAHIWAPAASEDGQAARPEPAEHSESAERSEIPDRSEATGTRAKADKHFVLVGSDVAGQLGIEVSTAQPGILAAEIHAVGTVGFNDDRLARIVPRVAGSVRQVLKAIGDKIEAGETLAVLDSKDVADAKALYLAAKDKLTLAETTSGHEEALFNKHISSEQELINSRRELAQARGEMRVATQALRTLGFRDPDLKALETAPDDLSRFDIVAPFAGELVEKQIFVGEFVAADRQVFVVADLDMVRVALQIPPDKIDDVEVGRAVTINGPEGLSAHARLDYMAPTIASDTRSGLARVNLPNPEHRWMPGTLIEALIDGNSENAAVTVPSEALQTVGGRMGVFVPVEGGFRLQVVEAGRSNGTVTEIVKGLKPGDKVATGRTFVLKSELEKGGEEDND